MGLKMNNHQRTVFVVMYIARDNGSVIVGVYDDQAPPPTRGWIFSVL